MNVASVTSSKPTFESPWLTIIVGVVAATMLAGTPLAHADGTTFAPERHHFHRISVKDGLSETRVHCIHQDRIGYMWFGTGDGLNRFDGHDILVFRPENLDSKTPYIVTSIHEDRDGFLWLGETNTEFSKFDPATGTFLEHHRYEPGNPAGVPYKTHLTIRGAPDETLWIGTGWVGLLRFDPRTAIFSHFPHRESTGESTKRDGVYAVYSSEPDSNIVWLGTESSGLIRLDTTTGRLHRFRDDPPGTHAMTPPNGVIFIGEESPSVLWVGGENGQLYRFDLQTERFLSVHRFDSGVGTTLPQPGLIMGVVRDSEGRIWVASQNAGLAEFRQDEGFCNRQQHDPEDAQSLSNNLLTQLYRDRSGVVWLATKRDGVSFFAPQANWIRHDTLRDENGRHSNPMFVQSFYQEDGNPDIVWLGSGAGLTRWNRKLNHYKYYRYPLADDSAGSPNAIRCFSARRTGGFWIGTAVGLSRYDPATDRLLRVASPPDESGRFDDLSHGSIRAVREDRNGDVWIGVLPAIRRLPGLLRFNPESGDVRAYHHDPGDPHSIGPGWVTRIHEDRQGRLWFASHMGGKGISRFDRQTDRFIRFQHDPADPDSLRDDAVRAFHEDRKQDVLWIGTRSGLDQIAIGPQAALREFKHIDLGDSNDDLLGIEQDDSGNLWLASKSGLRLMANRDEGIPGAAVVAPDTANRFQLLNDSYLKLHSGEILIGSLTGFFEIRPDRFQPGEPPPVVIADVRLPGGAETSPTRENPDSGTILVSHDQNKVLTFKFAALDFANPKQRRYAYRLEGLEQDWHYDSKGHTATYTTLPAGDYVFRVKASTSQGLWNEEGASLAITVLSPWWATWWYRSGTAIALSGPDGGVVRWRNLSLRRRNRLLALSEQRYLNLLANTSELLWCIEFDEPVALDLPEMEQVERIFGARVVEANEAFARAYDSTLDEVIDRWRVEDFLPRSLPTSVPFLLEAVRLRYRMKDVETTEHTPDGEAKIFVNNFLGTIQEGKVFRVWGMCRDVTKMREIEEQIHMRQKAIESSNDGVVIADASLPDLPVVYVNRRFEEITGYTADEILGRNCRFLQGAGSDSETVTRFRESLAAGTRFQGEVLNYRKDGSPFWIFLRISPVRNKNGEITHFIGLQTDVTERKRADEASRQQQDQLAHVARAATLVEIGAALAHELNQPLAAILRNAQAAQRFLNRDAPDLDQVGEILADIVKDDRRAGDVLGRIRQHLRNEESRRDRVDMNHVVQDGLALLHSELIIKHVDVELQLAEGLPPILGDAVQLQQVVLNLVMNAVEAMCTAQPDDSRIIIETSSVDDDTVSVAVSDSGQGIEESDLERIFDPFHTTKEQGMGVGLSINRTIVESHDGKLWAENLPEGGARFVFTIRADNDVS